MRRTVRYLVLCVAVILLGYLGVGNWLVNSDFLKGQINTWEDGHLEYRRALTLFPGRVLVYDAVLRHHDRNVEWTVYLDGAALSIQLLPLLRSRLIIASTRAEGAAFHFRMRRSQDVRRKVAAGILPPFKDFFKPSTPRAAEPAKGWHVRMSDVQVRKLKDIWISEYRYRGDASVTGGFSLQAGTWAEIGPAQFRALPGELRLGETQVARALQTEVTATISKFSADVSTEQFFSYFTGKISLDSPEMDLGFLNYYLRPVKWLRIVDGNGPLRLSVVIERGKIVASSSVAASAPNTRLTVRNVRISGASSVSFSVGGAPAVPEGKLVVQLSPLRVTFPMAGSAPFDVRRCRIEGTSRQLELAGGFPDLAIYARFDGATLEAPRTLNAYLRGTGMQLTSGRVSADAEWRAPHPGADSGSVSVTLDDLSGSVFAAPFRSSGTFVSRFDQSSMRNGFFHLAEGEARFEGEMVSAESSAPPRYRARLSLVPGGSVTLTPFRAAAEAVLSASSPDGFFREVASKLGVPGVALALVSLSELSGQLALKSGPSGTVARLISAEAGAIQARGTAWLNEGRGTWLFRAGPLALALDARQGGRRWILHEAENWYQRRSSSLAE